MSRIELLNIDGQKVSDINLQDNIWNIEPNDAVLYNSIILAQASLRQGTANTKTRSEVSGGGRKPWKQKGTGNARQGSIRATQWRGGGIVFGPKPRSFNKKMNRKERRLALKSALAYKAINSNLMVLDKMVLDSFKTKDMIKLLTNLKLSDKKVLLVAEELNDNLILASRNLSNIMLLEASEINVLDIAAAEVMLLTENALKQIEEVLK